MGKFTEEFFGFPIKIYDGFSLKKALEEEDKPGTDAPVSIDWIVGHVKIPAKDLHRIMWHDGFSRERSVGEVAEKGFDLTIVVSDVHGEFVCTWPRKKFEEKIDAFVEKYEDEQKKRIAGLMDSTGPMYITGVDPFKDMGFDKPEDWQEPKKPEE